MDRLFRGEGRKEQVLSRHETAKAIREATLDMFRFGSNGSDRQFPTEPATDAVKIPVLLRYSKETKDHYQTLLGVLSAPREFQITERPESGWREDEPSGDVIHHREEIGDFYTFAHYLTSSYLRSLMIAMDKKEKGEPYLDVSIRGFKDGVWKVHYDFSPWSIYTIFDTDYMAGNYSIEKRSIGGGAESWQPEKALLVNFVFSPKPLATRYFNHQWQPRITQRYLSDAGKRKVGAFQVQQVDFDAKGMAAELKKRDRLDPRPGVQHSDNSLEIYALEKEGDRTFNIVNLGRTNIGNLTHHVYSVSEQPLIKERIPQLSATAQSASKLIPLPVSA